MNAEASNGSNSRTTRNRFRSGSNKVNNNKKEDSATSRGSNIISLKNPKITINVNNASDNPSHVIRGVMTTKTALEMKEIQIFPTKSRDNRNLKMQMKSA